MFPKPSRDRPVAETASHSPAIDATRLGPTPERLRQARAAGPDAVQDVVTEVAAGDTVEKAATRRLLDGDVLELLLKRGVIDAEQYACGRDFHRHWERSPLGTSGVVDLERPRVDGGQHKPESEARLHHLTEWKKLVVALGAVHSAPLCICVLEGQSLEDYGLRRSGYRNGRQARDWAQARLTGALEQLVHIMLGDRRARTVAARGETPRHRPEMHEKAS